MNINLKIPWSINSTCVSHTFHSDKNNFISESCVSVSVVFSSALMIKGFLGRHLVMVKDCSMDVKRGGEGDDGWSEQDGGRRVIAGHWHLSLIVCLCYRTRLTQ